MNETNETLADIVREMRDHGGPDYNWAASKGDLRKLADRIEAAAAEQNAEIARLRYCLDERGKLLESAQAKMHEAQAASGNAAALREALEASAQFWESIEHKRQREIVLARQITCALSAPARNCDRFTKRDAAEEFAREIGEINPDDVDAEEFGEWMGRNWFLFRNWLFAPAQEGGAE